jgi:mono/diheme cytochrome c family protein
MPRALAAQGGTMYSSKARTVLAGVAVAAVLAAIFWAGRRSADQPAPTPAQQPIQTTRAPEAPPAEFVDDNQRAIAIYEFKKAAQSGPDRGREIFYYKCWFCHNEFAGPQSAPNLATVFQRKQLLSGRPATEDGIKDEIRNGGEGMAAYKFTLDDADVNDLVSYLKDGCCWNSDSPPPNPRFRGNPGGLTQ